MWKAFIQSATSESQGSVASNTEAPTSKCEGLHPPLGPARHQRPISTWGCIWHSLLASIQVMKQDLASCSKFSQFSYLNTTRSSGHRGQMVSGSRDIQRKPLHRSGVPWFMLEPIKFYCYYCMCLENILRVWKADCSPCKNFVRAVAATGAAGTDSTSGWCSVHLPSGLFCCGDEGNHLCPWDLKCVAEDLCISGSSLENINGLGLNGFKFLGTKFYSWKYFRNVNNFLVKINLRGSKWTDHLKKKSFLKSC